ncbi:MAG: KOW domain-containing RNA-binding protein [Clostridia bacterium]|nr:KOW domain-containing RNA-binding protein [Clostridia bacterium]
MTGEKMQEICVGMVVKSKAGRDKGRYFVVYSMSGDGFVCLVDGDLRTLAKPKRKKIKHLRPMGVVLVSLFEREAGAPLNDAHIRRALKDAGFAGKNEQA